MRRFFLRNKPKKIVKGFSKLSYPEKLIAQNLPSPEHRRRYGTMEILKKSWRNSTMRVTKNLFELNLRMTRGNPSKLRARIYRTEARRNKLPGYIATSRQLTNLEIGWTDFGKICAKVGKGQHQKSWSPEVKAYKMRIYLFSYTHLLHCIRL